MWWVGGCLWWWFFLGCCFVLCWWLWVDFDWGTVANIGGLGGSNCGSECGFLGSNLEVGLDVAKWVFAFGFVLSCFLGCGECGSYVVVLAVAVGWRQLVVVVVVGW